VRYRRNKAKNSKSKRNHEAEHTEANPSRERGLCVQTVDGQPSQSADPRLKRDRCATRKPQWDLFANTTDEERRLPFDPSRRCAAKCPDPTPSLFLQSGILRDCEPSGELPCWLIFEQMGNKSWTHSECPPDLLQIGPLCKRIKIIAEIWSRK